MTWMYIETNLQTSLCFTTVSIPFIKKKQSQFDYRIVMHMNIWLVNVLNLRWSKSVAWLFNL